MGVYTLFLTPSLVLAHARTHTHNTHTRSLSLSLTLSLSLSPSPCLVLSLGVSLSLSVSLSRSHAHNPPPPPLPPPPPPPFSRPLTCALSSVTFSPQSPTYVHFHRHTRRTSAVDLSIVDKHVYAAAHCISLLFTAATETHCNALQRMTSLSLIYTCILQLTATHCNSLQRLQRTATQRHVRRTSAVDPSIVSIHVYTATHCNTLQRTATHCNSQAQ